MKITKAGGFYILITILLGFAAVNTGNNLLFLIVSGLLAFMSVTGYIGMVNIQRLSVRVKAPEEIYAGIPAGFLFDLSNQKSKTPSFLLKLSCGESSAVCGFLAAGGNFSMTLPLARADRGWHRISSVQVSSPFPVNFFIRWWRLPVECEFIVFPMPELCNVRLPGEDGDKSAVGSYPVRGHEGELERILEYTGCEPLKLIHWKLSARGEGLKVKEYGEPAAEPIVVDLERLDGSLEHKVSCAAWMVRHFGVSRAVGLKLGDELIQPRQGLSHTRRLLARLAVYGINRQP